MQGQKSIEKLEFEFQFDDKETVVILTGTVHTKDTLTTDKIEPVAYHIDEGIWSNLKDTEFKLKILIPDNVQLHCLDSNPAVYVKNGYILITLKAKP